jgi:hypothetical protein
MDPDFDLDLSATTLLLNTSNIARDGRSSQLKFFEGRTPTQIRMLALKKLSREWTLDHYELNRQVQGLNFTVADVYDNYLTSLQGISKELEVERFTQTTVMEMIACTDTFGPEEVDIPVSDANVERHLEFLCQRLGYASLVGSDLWTKELPIGLWYESTKGLHTLREQQSLRSGETLSDQDEQSIKKRKTEIRQVDIQSPTSETDPMVMVGDIYDLPELTPMMNKKTMAKVAPTTPTMTGPSDDHEAPDVGQYLHLMIDQLSQLNDNLREQRQDMKAMRALLEGNHETKMVDSIGNDGTNDDSVIDTHGNSNSIIHYLSSIENKIHTLATAISKDTISFNRKQASVIQGQHDLRLTMGTWKDGLINELTGIHKTIHDNQHQSDHTRQQEQQNINQIRLDNFLEVALDMMENISIYKTQSDFQSRMLRNIDDDVAYLRRVHTIEERDIPAS